MKLAMMWLCLLTAGVQAAGFLGGGDISMLTKVEQAGVVFKDEGQTKELIRLMQDNGCTCFRLRLFVNPNGRGGVVQDIPYTITLAKRIKAAGAVFMLDLHYSDTWADPAHQTKPAAWKDLPYEDLVRTVESYTAQTIGEFRKQDVLPELVQVGNEIHPGFLWPDGRGIGVLWWYPESVPTKQSGGWNGGITALFDKEGNALPAMKSFKGPSATK